MDSGDKMKTESYDEFKAKLGATKCIPPVKEQAIEDGVFTETPQVSTEQGSTPHAEAPKEAPKSEAQGEVKHNGHKDPSQIIETVEVAKPDADAEKLRAEAFAKEQKETRDRMVKAEKEKNIPGNGYMFNRDREHLLETAIINQLQLHMMTVSKIQTMVLNPDWDSANHMVADMYVDLMLEGSIAVDGESRKQFVGLTQFKNEEKMQAARGGLFDSGPTG
jgi:hypothetical protein